MLDCNNGPYVQVSHVEMASPMVSPSQNSIGCPMIRLVLEPMPEKEGFWIAEERKSNDFMGLASIHAASARFCLYALDGLF